MTHDKWIKLTKEERCIKVGELCGWQGPFRKGNVHIHGFPSGMNVPKDADKDHGTRYWMKQGHVPDYLNDLNAMHEVEQRRIMESDTVYAFMVHLVRICDAESWRMNPISLIHATAAQRAEAFVLTMEPE